MLTHEQIWRGVDRLALRNGLSPSGLAKRAGLDPTTFNKSKRVTQDGKQRWPGTESLSKILEATQSNLADLVSLIDEVPATQPKPPDFKFRSIRLSQITDASFDKSGFPEDSGWEEVDFPSIDDPRAYIVELDKDAAHHFCRPGSFLVISPSSSVRRHDRVMIKTKQGDMIIGTIKRKTAQQYIIAEANVSPDDLPVNAKDIDWTGRIVWASQ